MRLRLLRKCVRNSVDYFTDRLQITLKGFESNVAFERSLNAVFKVIYEGEIK